MATDLTFAAEVTEEAMGVLMERVLLAIESGEREVRLFLTTYGGELSTAFTFYDRMRALQRELSDLSFVVIATGYCLSAGTVMLQAGTERIAYPHTVFMLHQPSQYPWDDHQQITFQELHDRHTLQELLIGHLTDIYSAHCTPKALDSQQSVAQYWRERLTDTRQDFFTPERAYSMGLIDRIESVSSVR